MWVPTDRLLVVQLAPAMLATLFSSGTAEQMGTAPSSTSTVPVGTPEEPVNETPNVTLWPKTEVRSVDPTVNEPTGVAAEAGSG